MKNLNAMNRINTLFLNKPGRILSVYFTAGYPELNDTARIIQLLEKYGADLVEVGMPFSDPVADGPVIQKSNSRALENGMSLEKLFNQLKDIRSRVNIPLILMGYFNPVFHMGMEKFLEQCTACGVDGVIIPDLPPEEYNVNYKGMFTRYGIAFIMLITPQTPVERINYIDSVSEGFIYMVSASSTTGMKKGLTTDQTDYFNRIKNMKLKNPCLAGFGISDRDAFDTACRYVSGAIIGSAFIKAIGEPGDVEENIIEFMNIFPKYSS